MSGRRHSVRIKRIAVDFYSRGHSPKEICDHLGAAAPSRSTIRRWVEEHGIMRSRSESMFIEAARRFSKDYNAIRRRARLLADENLWSAKFIAALLGVSPHTIRKSIDPEFRHANGDAQRRRYWQAAFPDVDDRRSRRDLAIQLRARGERLAAIATRVQASLPTVWRWLRDAGLTKPTCSGLQETVGAERGRDHGNRVELNRRAMNHSAIERLTGVTE